MNRDTHSIVHLERSVDDNRLRRALAARLDKGFRCAGLSSAQAAKRLNVYEGDVQNWRGASRCLR
jgi:hypothetical protein